VKKFILAIVMKTITFFASLNPLLISFHIFRLFWPLLGKENKMPV